ncbi:CpsB/CapC family capsule biosynthesis tyrosine phosphatase [Thiocapsa sp. UBA6158]|jgi:hypothetical protein|uniref:CpsB/CapC family capsule biosynthesis tyrosine phosphatase n=1 Tax=Thiocapsa sp. UBA6158 TaxID=1947692 RepID=UPI0025E980E3|nr:CpsB/CapC family capsule biosynthesis tyrosine phosphatase [Thiocapsa sp. UBA6158]
MRLQPAVIDAHCHSLPGLDDVAHTVETAIEMSRAAGTGGTGGILCTPHHLNGVYKNPATTDQGPGGCGMPTQRISLPAGLGREPDTT